jgi:hypothetical protein
MAAHNRSWPRLAAATFAACMLFPPLASAAGEAFKVRLTPVPIEASTAAKTKGNGSATVALDGTTLTVNGSFAGLQGAATVARLHEGAATGVRGPAVADITVPQSTSGSFTATLTLTAAQAESLRQGRMYLQIDSTAAPAPDGNLWGWVLR